MARAVVDFVWQQDDLQPTGKPEARAYVMAWQDDPYSVDLAEQFEARVPGAEGPGRRCETVLDRIAYSVGTFTDPNPPEREVLDRILPDLAVAPERPVAAGAAGGDPAGPADPPGVRRRQPADRASGSWRSPGTACRSTRCTGTATWPGRFRSCRSRWSSSPTRTRSLGTPGDGPRTRPRCTGRPRPTTCCSSPT